MSLQFERRPHSADQTRSAGVLPLGQRDLLPGVAQAGLPAVLHPARAITERWTSASPVRSSRTGLIRHQDDGQWLYGEAVVPMPATGVALQALTHQLYADLFRTLRAHGGRHLLKIWNYLPRLNAELDGLEVYRHFNIGRQQAFLDAGAAAFEGAPAACAKMGGASPTSPKSMEPVAARSRWYAA